MIFWNPKNHLETWFQNLIIAHTTILCYILHDILLFLYQEDEKENVHQNPDHTLDDFSEEGQSKKIWCKIYGNGAHYCLSDAPNHTTSSRRLRRDVRLSADSIHYRHDSYPSLR